MGYYREYLQNLLSNARYSLSFEDVVFSVGVFFVGFLVLLIIKLYLSRFFSRIAKLSRSTLIETIALELASVPIFLVLFVSLYLGIYSLAVKQISYRLGVIIDTFFLLILLLYVVKAVNRVIKEYSKKLVKTAKDASTASVYSYLSTLFQVVVWILSAILVISNLGIDISALVAGLGIGGVAIALAARDIVSDIISSLLIIVNKIISVGDYVKLGDEYGQVKQIRIKSTIVRTNGGYNLIVPNSDFVSKAFKNYHSGLKQKINLVIIFESKQSPSLKELKSVLKKSVQKLPESNVKEVVVRLAELKRDQRKYEVEFIYLFPRSTSKGDILAEFLSDLWESISKKSTGLVSINNESLF